MAHLFSLPCAPFLPCYILVPGLGCSGFPFILLTPQTLDAAEVQDDLSTGQLRVCGYCGKSTFQQHAGLHPKCGQSHLDWRKRVIYCSILSFSEPPKLNPVVEPLSWMLGTWLSDPPGVGTFPTLQPFQYLEEVHISHVGQPMLNFS